MHDWSLVSMTFDWKRGVAELTFLTSPENLVYLKAEGVAELDVSRRFPWGKSLSVNEVRKSITKEMNHRFVIEMQSGDIISIEATNIVVT